MIFQYGYNHDYSFMEQECILLLEQKSTRCMLGCQYFSMSNVEKVTTASKQVSKQAGRSVIVSIDD